MAEPLTFVGTLMEANTEVAGALPLFYKAPAPLLADRHADKTLGTLGSYPFARGTNSVPINGDEFWQAARDYPIVFTKGALPVPIALLGIRAEQNLFLGEDGAWDSGSYVPAYVRRYPFIFMSAPDSDKLVLCVDEDSDLIEDGGERPLYKDGKPTEIVENALKFCADFQQRHQVTMAFAQALADNGLLIERAANITLRSGETVNLTGFSIIDQAKLDELPNKLFLDWRKRGWLPLIYLHMISLQSWNNLVDRAAEGDKG